MALSEDFLMELRNRNSIEDVISSYVAIAKGGRNPKCLCPFHGEKTPSFTLYPETESFYCFGCGLGGDVIRFIRLIENLDYIDAVKFLADRCGMEMPTDNLENTLAKKKRTIYAINRETAHFFHNALYSPDGKMGLDYYHKRGLSDKIIKHFGLGFAKDSWDALVKHLRSKGYSDDDMLLANVAVKGRNDVIYDRFRKRTMFPVVDVRGNVIAFSGRRLFEQDSKSKYINSSDTPVWKKSQNVFGLNFAKNYCNEYIILCEGNMDVVALHRLGYQNAVAPLGTSFTEEQAKLLSHYTNKIILMLDSDEAGQKATERCIEILEKVQIETKIAHISAGKDPDEFIEIYKDSAPQKMKQVLSQTLSVVDYRLQKASGKLNVDTSDEDKRLFLESAAKILARVSSPIEREITAGRLAEKYGISKDAILLTAKQHYKRERATRQKKEIDRVIHPDRRDPINPDRPKHSRAANAEEGIIAILMRNPKVLSAVEPDLSPDDFITDFNRRIFLLITERIKNGKPLDITLLGEQLTDGEIEKLAQILAKRFELIASVDECNGCISTLKQEKVKQIRSVKSDSDFDDIINKIKNSKE